MATSRDVKMTLSVDTLGEDGVKSLQQSIQTLANQGGSAAPQFQKLADEVARLGEQSQSLAAFQALADQTEALKVKQEATAATSQKLATTLDSLKVSTDAAKAKQQESTNTLVAAQVALVNAGTAIRTLKADYDNAGKQTKAYRDELKELIAKQAAAKAEVIQLGAAQKVANKELSDATTEQNKAATAYARSEKAAQASAKALKEQETAVREAATATAKLGLAVDDVATAEGTLIASLNKAGAEAQQYSARVQEMAESDRLLAIQQRGLAELYARGAAALQAETLAQRDAARSNAEYDASLAKVNAEKAKMADNAAQWRREADALVAASLSAQKLERDTRVLVATERELAGINAFEKQYVEAQKLRQAADYVRFWTTELDKAELATKQMQDAFNTLNVRSADTIRSDIAAVRAALQTVSTQAVSTGSSLSGAFTAGKAKLDALELELRQLNGTMTLGDKTAKLFANSMGQITAGNVLADGVGYLVNKVKELTVEFFNVNLESQRLTKALTQIYGSTESAGTQFEFLRRVTNDAGVSIRDVSDGFLRFSAATQTSGISLQQSNAVFEQVSRAAGFLGLKGEQVTGVLEALGQMASKGTVSLEELRGQLGDRLPGALGIAAKGMGMTQAELIKMIESGNLATNVFFPAFTKGLEDTFGAGEKKIDGFIQGWNRLTNAIVKTAQEASNSTAFTNMGKAFDFVAENIKAVVTGLELLAARFAIVKALDIAASFFRVGTAAQQASIELVKKVAVVNQDTVATELNTKATTVNTAAKSQNAAAWTALGAGVLGTSTKVKEGTAAIEASTLASRAATTAKAGLTAGIGLLGTAAKGLTGFLGGPIGAMITFALYAKDIGTFIGETAAKMTGWGAVLEKNEKQVAALAAAEKKAAEDRARAQAEQDVANIKASAAAVAATKQAELSVLSAEKEVKAKEQKLKATQDLVNLQGPEAQGLDALVAASDEVTRAAQNELTAKENLVKKAQEEIAAVQATVGANGQLTKAQQEQIAKLNELLAGRQAEVDKQGEVIRQLQIEAAGRRVAAEAAKDNSLRVAELAQAWEDAKSKVEVLGASGMASMEQIAAAEIEAAAAAKIFRDAIADSIAAIDLKGRAEAAVINTTIASTNASKAHYEAMAKAAETQGDYSRAVYYSISAKQAERASIEASIKLKQLEIQVERDKIQAEYDGIKGTDAVATAKRAELAIRLEVIKAKQIELGASKDAIKALDAEIAALLNGTKQLDGFANSSKNAAGGQREFASATDAATSALEAQNAATERANNAKEKAIELENKRRGVDKNGFATNSNGETIVMSTPTERGVYDQAKSNGLTDTQALQIMGEFMSNGQQVVPGGLRKNETWSVSLQKSIDTLVLQNVQAKSYEEQGLAPNGSRQLPKATTPGTTTASNAPTTTTSGTKTVNVTINGRSQSVNVASDADANALTSILRSLESAANTSS